MPNTLGQTSIQSTIFGRPRLCSMMPSEWELHAPYGLLDAHPHLDHPKLLHSRCEHEH